MGLTYKKRDDLDKLLGEFASFPDDILVTDEKAEVTVKKENTDAPEKSSKENTEDIDD